MNFGGARNHIEETKEQINITLQLGKLTAQKNKLGKSYSLEKLTENAKDELYPRDMD